LENLGPGPDRHREFRHDDGITVERDGDLARRLVDVFEIGVPVAMQGRRADRNEDHVRGRDGRGQIGREFEMARADRLGDDPFETGFVNRNFGGLQARDPGPIPVDARHIDPEFGKTRQDTGKVRTWRGAVFDPRQPSAIRN